MITLHVFYGHPERWNNEALVAVSAAVGTEPRAFDGLEAVYAIDTENPDDDAAAACALLRSLGYRVQIGIGTARSGDDPPPAAIAKAKLVMRRLYSRIPRHRSN